MTLTVMLSVLPSSKTALARPPPSTSGSWSCCRPDRFCACAFWLASLSLRLSELGQLDDAVSAAEGAVAIYWDLAAGNQVCTSLSCGPQTWIRTFLAHLNCVARKSKAECQQF